MQKFIKFALVAAGILYSTNAYALIACSDLSGAPLTSGLAAGVAVQGNCWLGQGYATDPSNANTAVDGSNVVANLAAGTLSVNGPTFSNFGPVGYASGILWNTVTYSGLPKNGEIVTETLSLTSSATNPSGSADVFAFPTSSGGTNAGNSASFGTGMFGEEGNGAMPGKVTFSFLATNGSSFTYGAEINAFAGNSPIDGRFSVTTSAVSAVPEAPTYLMAALGLAAIALVRRRRGV